MISTVDHTARTKMGLSLSEYAIIDHIHQLRDCDPNYKAIAETLGVSPGQVSKAITKGMVQGLLRREKGKKKKTVSTSRLWVDIIKGGPENEGHRPPYRELAKEGISYLNERLGKNGNGYEWKTYEKEFKAIANQLIKKYPDVSLQRLILNIKAVVDHKIIHWSEDPEMSKYLRPSTLFSGKFHKYLDEARTFYKSQRQ